MWIYYFVLWITTLGEHLGDICGVEYEDGVDGKDGKSLPLPQLYSLICFHQTNGALWHRGFRYIQILLSTFSPSLVLNLPWKMTDIKIWICQQIRPVTCTSLPSRCAGSPRWWPAGRGTPPSCPGSTWSWWWGKGGQMCSYRQTLSSPPPDPPAGPEQEQKHYLLLQDEPKHCFTVTGQRGSEIALAMYGVTTGCYYL